MWVGQGAAGGGAFRGGRHARPASTADRTWMAHSVVAATSLPGTMGGGRPRGSRASCRTTTGKAAASAPAAPGCAAAAGPASTSPAARSTAEASSSANTWCPRSEGCNLSAGRGDGRAVCQVTAAAHRGALAAKRRHSLPLDRLHALLTCHSTAAGPTRPAAPPAPRPRPAACPAESQRLPAAWERGRGVRVCDCATLQVMPKRQLATASPRSLTLKPGTPARISWNAAARSERAGRS